jgi:hypothetical protein
LRFSLASAFRIIKLLESQGAKAGFSLNMLLPASVQEAGFALSTWEIAGWL